MEKVYGIIPIRKCLPQEECMLKEKLQKANPQLEKAKGNQIYWMNIYLNGKFNYGKKEEEEKFFNWCSQLLEQIEGSPQYITSYGFLNSPKAHKKFQNFHFDYESRTYKSILIPFNYLVYGNSTQFLNTKPKSQPKTLLQNGKPAAQFFGQTQKEFLQQEGVDFLTLCQVICKPFVILKVQGGTVHRGIANSTEEDRLVFFLGYNQEKMFIKEDSVYRFRLEDIQNQ